MPAIPQFKIHQELTKLLPLGYAVISERDAYLTITSPSAAVVAQVELSKWSLQSEANLCIYLANLSSILLRYLQV